VRGTVDLRALTKTPPPGSSSRDIREAIEENMMLVVESARAIGCSINDGMDIQLANGDHKAIDKIVKELIKARTVNLPNMEDEPASTFDNLSLMMEKLGIQHVSEDETDGGAEQPRDTDRLKGHLEEKPSPQGEQLTTLREERIQKTPEIDLNKPTLNAELTYEERAAIRRAEREKRRKERETLAVSK
jgi:hypothetical protein